MTPLLLLLSLAVLPAALAISLPEALPASLSWWLWGLSALGTINFFYQWYGMLKLQRRGDKIVPLLESSTVLLELLDVRRTQTGVAFCREWMPHEVEVSNPTIVEALDSVLRIAKEIGKERVVSSLVKDRRIENLDESSGDASGIFSTRGPNV